MYVCGIAECTYAERDCRKEVHTVSSSALQQRRTDGRRYTRESWKGRRNEKGGKFVAYHMARTVISSKHDGTYMPTKNSSEDDGTWKNARQNVTEPKKRRAHSPECQDDTTSKTSKRPKHDACVLVTPLPGRSLLF